MNATPKTDFEPKAQKILGKPKTEEEIYQKYRKFYTQGKWMEVRDVKRAIHEAYQAATLGANKPVVKYIPTPKELVYLKAIGIEYKKVADTIGFLCNDGDFFESPIEAFDHSRDLICDGKISYYKQQAISQIFAELDIIWIEPTPPKSREDGYMLWEQWESNMKKRITALKARHGIK